MKADDWQMSKVFLGGGDVQYVLPIFQREFAWEEEEWQTLLDDVMVTYKESQSGYHEHFLGSLVVIEEDSRKTLFQSYTLVDGQQRLTSISLLLCALRDSLEDPRDKKQIDKYLLNADEHGDLRYKILPTVKYDDRQAYRLILDGKPVDGLRSRVPDAYCYFKQSLHALLANSEIDSDQLLSCILGSLCIVFIELNRTDKPYKIFESLNHKGKALTEADLVRNYVAMTLPPDRQQEVFDDHWLHIEDLLSEHRTTANIPELTAFLRHYLAFRSGELPLKDRVFVGFRDRVEKLLKADDDRFILEIETLHRFAGYYDKFLRPSGETRDPLRRQLERLRVLQATTAYPLLLHFYDLHDGQVIAESELIQLLKVTENYLVRRFLAGERTNYHNSMFTSLARELSLAAGLSAARLEAVLGERNYPSDKRLRQRLMWNNLYKGTGKPKRLSFVLETLNHQFDSDIVLADAATIEHIMPQSLNHEWKAHLGDGWQEIHRELLHTIGNLTIVTQDWNVRKLSNRSFSIKRKHLRNHGIHLNAKYFSSHNDSWNANAIRDRTNYLADRIVEVWPPFSEPRRSEEVSGKKPRSLTVRGSVFPVNAWKRMVLQMVNHLHELGLLVDFGAAHLEFGNMIVAKHNRPDYMYDESSRGWQIFTWVTAVQAVDFCIDLAKYCGLQDDEWSFAYR